MESSTSEHVQQIFRRIYLLTQQRRLPQEHRPRTAPNKESTKVWDLTRYVFLFLSLLLLLSARPILTSRAHYAYIPSLQQNKPKVQNYELLVASFAIFSVIAGYVAGVQPIDKWRFFSWHPFLMTMGMVGLAGVGAITKKLGGYNNTKLHAIIGWLAIFASGGGIYCIYRNKEINGFSHLKSPHSICGAGVAVSFLSLGLAGSIFLHPDFGIDKTNKLIRTAHKLASRATIAVAWVTALGGLLQLGAKPMILALYALPLLALAPLSLI